MARVLHRCLVEPSPSGAALPERALPLTYLDALWLASSPVERVFYYPVEATDDVVSNLKHSLSRALRDFYPLAGRFRLTPGTTNRYELHYQPGDGVTFTVAEYDDAGVEELATDDPKEIARIAPLVPPPPEGDAVLALQATKLRGGLALAVTIHHSACDGASSTHFLHTWATAAAGAGASSPEPPVVDRTFVRDRDDLYDSFAAQGRWSHDSGGDLGSSDKLFATFTLSKEHLQIIKDTVAREAARRGVPTPRCTTVVATFGFVWQCHLRAVPDPGERATLVIPADLRARLRPPVPGRYLGNCVGPCVASAPTAELAAAGAAGLFAAAGAVAGAVDEAARGGAAYWDGWLERLPELLERRPLLTAAGSPRFRVYDLDFGFGRPAKVDIVSVAKTGAVAVAEARGGGTEVGVALPADGMERFRKCFAESMECISSSP